MKMRVTKASNSWALKVLNLNSNKKSSLIDVISTSPELAMKAATRRNIFHGFYKSGLIDQTKSRYPVLLKYWEHVKYPSKRTVSKLLTILLTCTES